MLIQSYPEATAAVKRISHTEFSDEAPEINAADQDLARVTDKAWDALLCANDPDPYLFIYGGEIVRVEDGHGDGVTLRPLTVDRARHELARKATWYRLDRGGCKVPAKPPRDLAVNLLATPSPCLPQLRRLTTFPFFSSLSELIAQSGYHAGTQAFCCLPNELESIAVSDAPNSQEIRSAVNLITEHLFGDFPFVSPPDRAHAVGALLLPFVRDLIAGPTPLHLVDKPAPGTGATLLVQAICDVFGGSPLLLTEARCEDEWSRKIYSALKSRPNVVVIDNVTRRLDSPHLSAALTADSYGDRTTGTSEIGSAPVRCLWVVTGNNVMLSKEQFRRTVPMRLDARTDRPEQRTGFRHSHLRRWVKENRDRLILSCLTLVQAWIAAGKPKGKRILGGYEPWSEVIGGILEVCGVAGFLENVDQYRTTSDADLIVKGFVENCFAQFGSAVVNVKKLLPLAEDLDLGPEQSRAIRLGKLLSSLRDRHFGEIRLECVGARNGVQHWRLVPVKGSAVGSDDPAK